MLLFDARNLLFVVVFIHDYVERTVVDLLGINFRFLLGRILPSKCTNREGALNFNWSESVSVLWERTRLPIDMIFLRYFRISLRNLWDLDWICSNWRQFRLFLVIFSSISVLSLYIWYGGFYRWCTRRHVGDRTLEVWDVWYRETWLIWAQRTGYTFARFRMINRQLFLFNC